jgi:polyisoprenoid-binding protein YceI
MKNKKYFLLVPLILVCFNIIKQWKFVDKNASITFKVIKNDGVEEATGTINGLKGGVFMDSLQINPIEISASVAVSTINTGIEMRDESLVSKDFFEATKYPTIKFTSNQFSSHNDSLFADGVLSIKNVSKKITIPFLKKNINDSTILSGKFTIDRWQYNVGAKDDGIANMVYIEFNLPIVKPD